MKKPYIKFFVGDWLSEPSLRGAGYYAKGVWIELMCLMAQSPKYGYLCHPDGRQMNGEDLREILGDGQAASDAVEKLKHRGTLSVDADGTIFCRRMVRDNELHEQYSRTSVESGAGRPVGGKKDDDFEALVAGGLNMERQAWDSLRRVHRGVDFGALVGAAVEANKVKPIENVAAWLNEAASGGKFNGTKKEGEKENEDTAIEAGVRKLFGRRATTPWSAKEHGAMRGVEERPDCENELAAIVRYYEGMRKGPSDKNYCRRDVATLLDNWGGEVDRAREFVSGAKKEKPKLAVEVNRTMVVTDWVERLEAIAKRSGEGGDEFGQAVSSIKGSFDKMGKNVEGKTVIEEIMEIYEYRKEGRISEQTRD